MKTDTTEQIAQEYGDHVFEHLYAALPGRISDAEAADQKQVAAGLIQDAIDLAISNLGEAQKSCEWSYSDDYSYFETKWGNGMEFTSDGIEENEYKFCPFCGGSIALHKKGQP